MREAMPRSMASTSASISALLMVCRPGMLSLRLTTNPGRMPAGTGAGGRVYRTATHQRMAPLCEEDTGARTERAMATPLPPPSRPLCGNLPVARSPQPQLEQGGTQGFPLDGGVGQRSHVSDVAGGALTRQQPRSSLSVPSEQGSLLRACGWRGPLPPLSCGITLSPQFFIQGGTGRSVLG